MCWYSQIFQCKPYHLFDQVIIFCNFSLNKLINIFNVITTLRNNNVKPWRVCTRWITKIIVGSIYIWKWVIRLQIDERYFIILLFNQLNGWFKPCFESGFIIAYYNWKRSLWYCIIYNLFKKILHFCNEKIIILFV